MLGNTTLLAGGGLNNQQDANSVLFNCHFSGNHAGTKGGGIYNSLEDGAQFEVLNSTLVQNTADVSGGGMANESIPSFPVTETRLLNCIIWNNSAAGGQFRPDGAGTFDVRYNCIEGYLGGGVGNITAHPHLNDPDGPDDVIGTLDDDAHLTSASPCVDAGQPDFVPLVDYDIDGEDRIQNDRIDMGADETPAADRCPSDLNADGFVDVNDLLAVVGAWGPCPNCNLIVCLADVNADCVVDVNDLLFVVGAWGPCP